MRTILLFLSLLSLNCFSETSKEVGGAAMYESQDIITNTARSKDHTTLVTAIKAAELVDTLNGSGPYTVFAPTNAAFEKLAPEVLSTILKSENKMELIKILKYHVISGKWNTKEIKEALVKKKGKVELLPLAGGRIWITMKGNVIFIEDEKGKKSKVTISDVNQKNGVIHVVDSVLMPL